ncbi:MAG TPA: hypothetical protein PLG73_16830, partial [Candidatus Sumerlaeota bacterium]|nr:hypothetical protein [Candidatus Sumerlaeota bacterium]
MQRQPPPSPARPTPRPLSRRRKAAFALAAALLLLLALEAGARLWLVYDRHLPAARPDLAALTYYPELRPLLLADLPPGADTCDVLLLGGSVL